MLMLQNLANFWKIFVFLQLSRFSLNFLFCFCRNHLRKAPCQISKIDIRIKTIFSLFLTINQLVVWICFLYRFRFVTFVFLYRFHNLPNTVSCDQKNILALIGGTGIGKTSFLANWLEKFRPENPDILVN